MASSRRTLQEFIEIYRSHPCLWNNKLKEYHDRQKRSKAYDLLINKLLEIEPGANKEIVVKKINNMRSNCRKERKKAEDSHKPGAGEIYSPKLWYYHLFNPINNPETYTESTSNVVESEDEDDFERIPQLHQDSTEHCASTSTEMISNQDLAEQTVDRPIAAKTKKSEEFSDKMLSVIHNYFKRPVAGDDQCDMIGKCFASKLKMVDRKQRLIVEMIMNEALWEAEQGNLTVNHRVYNMHQNNPSHYPGQFPVNTHSPCSINSSQCASPVPRDSQQIYICDELEVKKEPDT